MATYSHSKVSCFENCPYKYKLKYIDRVPEEIPAMSGKIKVPTGGED